MKNRIAIENTVKKYYHSTVACDKEKYILELLENSHLAPQIISCGEKCIETEYINGVTISGFIDDNESNLGFVIDKMIEWIKDFNTAAKNIVLDDINLKNFIYSDDKIYGIDFENWHYGHSNENCISILTAIKTAYFSNILAQQKLCSYIESCIGPVDNRALEKQTDRIHLRRRAMKNIRSCDCVIIAGGKSSRMGSPKGLLQYKGYTFIDHIIYNTSVFDRQYISANNNLYDKYGCEIIKDRYADVGPLGAIHAALVQCQSEYVFFIPCDMPFVNEESIFCLFDKMESGADAVVFTAGDRVFPTVGLYRKRVLPAVEKQIESGNYRMMKLLEGIKTQYVTAPFPQQFENINTIEDYKNIQKS